MEALLSRARRFFDTPYGVMAVVIAMYLVKVVAKVGFGGSMRSPMIEGDGWHNATDIFQAVVVIVGVYLSRRPPSKDYPFGWVALDGLLTLGIAAALGFAAVANVAVPSLAGLLNALPLPEWLASRAGTFLPSRLDAGPNALAAVFVMVASAGVSVAVSRYQVRVGTATGHASVVADGEETKSDGKIEALAAAGLVLQLVTGLAWLEYLFGLGMAYVMLKTTAEIFENGRDILFSRSLGTPVESGILRAVDETPGVNGCRALRTYRRGACLVADVEVVSVLGGKAREHIERHLVARIRQVLEDTSEGGGETAVTVRAVPPEAEETRWGFLARIEDGALRVIGDPYAATHLVVCEVTGGLIQSCRDVPVNADTLEEVIVQKRVRVVHVFRESGTRRYGRAEVRSVPSADPRLLGIPLA